MAESYVAVNTFGWKRREIVILAQECPSHTKKLHTDIALSISNR